VYLAGGMRNPWRETVKQAFPGVEWLDPSTHGLTDPLHYTKWDIDAIRACSNPVGYNLAFEIGLAVAWKKPVVFVDEKHAGNPRPCSMLRTSVSASCERLQKGIELFETIVAARDRP
jgi:hypothetical protein